MTHNRKHLRQNENSAEKARASVTRSTRMGQWIPSKITGHVRLEEPAEPNEGRPFLFHSGHLGPYFTTSVGQNRCLINRCQRQCFRRIYFYSKPFTARPIRFVISMFQSLRPVIVISYTIWIWSRPVDTSARRHFHGFSVFIVSRQRKRFGFLLCASSCFQSLVRGSSRFTPFIV